MTPEQRAKHLKAIEKIEYLPRPAKWRAIKRLVLDVHPTFVAIDDDFAQACKDIRQASQTNTGSTKSLDIRHTMKIPPYIYTALRELDPDLAEEMSGRNHGHQYLIGKQLYKAFPEYRIARTL